MRARTVSTVAGGLAAGRGGHPGVRLADRAQPVHAAPLRRTDARARRRTAADTAPVGPAPDARPAAQAGLGGRPGRPRPRPGGRDRRQHRRRGRARPGSPAPTGRCSRYPGAFVFGSNDYTGPVFKNPLHLLQPRPGVRAGRRPAGRGTSRTLLTGAGWADLNNARTTLKAGGRTDRTRRRRRPAHRAGRLRPWSPARLARRPTLTHRAHPLPRATGTRRHGGRRLPACCWPATPTAARSACPAYGALVTNCGLDRRDGQGPAPLARLPTSWLHVSAGLGTHPTAPVRFACRPEATLLDPDPPPDAWRTAAGDTDLGPAAGGLR